MILSTWAMIGTVTGGLSALLSIIVAVYSVNLTQRIASIQTNLSKAQFDISKAARESDDNAKQTNDYETAIALYERATQKSIFEEIYRASDDSLSKADIVNLSSTYTRLRLEQEALIIQKVLIRASDSDSDVDDSALGRDEKIQRAISEEIQKTLIDIANNMPESFLSKAEESLGKYFPTDKVVRTRNVKSLMVASDDVFSTHAKVLEMFGFEYKQWLRGWKTLNHDYGVWFPHINDSNADWINNLSNDGTELTERKRDDVFSPDEFKGRMQGTPIRFAFAYANWGNDTGYKFVGAYKPDSRKSDNSCVTYRRIDGGTKLFFNGKGSFDIKPLTADSPKI